MLRELKTFVAVAQEGTFAAAGQKIGLTQAAVSAQIQRLEEHLGSELFDRSGRNARLNAQGMHVLQQAQEVLRLFDEMAGGRQAPGRPGRVVLGSIASSQATVLPGVLERFHARHPTVQVRVVPGVSFNLLNQVDAGELDLALMIRPAFALQADLRWTRLSQERYWLLAPVALPAELGWHEMLATQPFIRYERTSFGGRLVDRFLRQAGIAVQERAEIDELGAMTQMVARGLGVALVPQVFGQAQWPEGVRVLDLGAQGFFREIGLLRRTSRMPHPAVADLADLIVQAHAGAADDAD